MRSLLAAVRASASPCFWARRALHSRSCSSAPRAFPRANSQRARSSCLRTCGGGVPGVAATRQLGGGRARKGPEQGRCLSLGASSGFPETRQQIDRAIVHCGRVHCPTVKLGAVYSHGLFQALFRPLRVTLCQQNSGHLGLCDIARCCQHPRNRTRAHRACGERVRCIVSYVDRPRPSRGKQRDMAVCGASRVRLLTSMPHSSVCEAPIATIIKSRA